jgi:hypothetical protein
MSREFDEAIGPFWSAILERGTDVPEDEVRAIAEKILAEDEAWRANQKGSGVVNLGQAAKLASSWLALVAAAQRVTALGWDSAKDTAHVEAMIRLDEAVAAAVGGSAEEPKRTDVSNDS